jgi:hypothetical protein
MVVGGGYTMQMADKPADNRQTKLKFLSISLTFYRTIMCSAYSPTALPLSPKYLKDRICDRQLGFGSDSFKR